MLSWSFQNDNISLFDRQHYNNNNNNINNINNRNNMNNCWTAEDFPTNEATNFDHAMRKKNPTADQFDRTTANYLANRFDSLTMVDTTLESGYSSRNTHSSESSQTSSPNKGSLPQMVNTAFQPPQQQSPNANNYQRRKLASPPTLETLSEMPERRLKSNNAPRNFQNHSSINKVTNISDVAERYELASRILKLMEMTSTEKPKSSSTVIQRPRKNVQQPTSPSHQCQQQQQQPQMILSNNGSADNSDSTSKQCNSKDRKPMQVHVRFALPRKQDSVYNVRYKTQPCLHYQRKRHCPMGDNCHFAHGPFELHRTLRHPKFKTRPCSNFVKTGFCEFGDDCSFVHPKPFVGGINKSHQYQ